MQNKQLKKVLIITYYWPPSGAIGVHRCLKFAKYLRDFGWEPIVYTAKDAQYPYLDDSNFKHIPEGIEILKQKAKDPFNLFKIVSGRRKDTVVSNPVHVREKKHKLIDKIAIWIRGNFFIPDARSLWIKPSVKYLSEYLKTNKIDAIISDGPPHTNTVIAYKLSEKFKIPWIADFQDPWTQVDYYKLFNISKFAHKKHVKLEQKAFAISKKITIASPSWKIDLESIGAKNVDVIFWGYDEDDFRDLKKNQTDKFVISHAGLLGFDRNPEVFFKVLKDLKSEITGFSDNLQIQLAGSVDYSVKESLIKENLEENTLFLGNIPRDKALKLTVDSDLLLLPLNIAENAMGRIPGKLFEQIRSNNPILCLGPKGSDVEKIITETKTGNSFEYSDYHGIKGFVKQVWLAGKTEFNTVEPEIIKDYSVKKQVKKISEYLNEITKN